MILAGTTAVGEFTTRNPVTGVRSYADSLPTGKLVRNGADTAQTVAVTEKETGVYQWSVAIPSTYERGDSVQVRINATVAAVQDNWDVWNDSVDLATTDLVDTLKDSLQATEVTVQ